MTLCHELKVVDNMNDFRSLANDFRSLAHDLRYYEHLKVVVDINEFGS